MAERPTTPQTHPEGREDVRLGRSALLLFIFILVTYGYFFNGGGWNQNAQFALTRSIVERGSFEISGYQGSEDVGYIDGKVYANKLPGPSFIAVVPYGALYLIERLAGADPGSPALLNLNGYICTLIACAVPGALIAVALLLYGVRVCGAPKGWSAIVAMLVCLGTPLFSYSSVLYRHVPVGSFLLLAFVLSSREIGRPYLGGFFAGLAGLSSHLAMPVIVLLMIRSVFEGGAKPLGRFVLGGIPGAILLGWYQLATTSSLLTITAAQNEKFVTEGAFLGFLGTPRLDVLVTILLSEHRGLLFLSPLLLFVLVGIVVLVKDRLGMTLLVVAGTIVWLLTFNASFNGWHGGWSIGPRYLAEGIPLAAVALLHLPRRRFVVALFLLAGAMSVFLNFVAVAVDPQPPLQVERPFQDYLLPVLAGGMPWSPPGSETVYVDHVNVNPVALDGSLRRSSSFNLGEFVFGTGSVLSLLPLLVWMAVGFWYAGRQWQAEASTDATHILTT